MKVKLIVMLSSADLERLISVKRLEIEKEKTQLGLLSPDHTLKNEDNKENTPNNIVEEVRQPDAFHHLPECERVRHERQTGMYEREQAIPADLERYIRRYIGLPGMLKTGEYSPNNPLLRPERGTRATRDVFLGLGDYEERNKTLRKLRQQQYREYLDQQAKKKQEEKEKLEREQKEAEERERIRQEEQSRKSSVQERRQIYVDHEVPRKVDTGIQCSDRARRPLSVAVQTDDTDFINMQPPSPKLTEAERELSPRTVLEARCDPDERPIKPAQLLQTATVKQDNTEDKTDFRRRSYDDGASSLVKKSNHDKMTSESYMPSIFDVEAIHKRNLKAEQEAAERRLFYQQELKNQIEEQQRIREERKTREKMLEMAEMRRLDEQLRMLNMARETETAKHELITNAMIESVEEYDKKRKLIQKDIDNEKLNSHRSKKWKPRPTQTSRSDNTMISKLPLYYKPITDRSNEICTKTEPRLPFSTNIAENSIFSPNYDVDTYLRRNLNPSKDCLGTKLDTRKFSYDRNSELSSKLNLGLPRNSGLESTDFNVISKRMSQSCGADSKYFSPRYDNEAEFPSKLNLDKNFGPIVNSEKKTYYEPSFMSKSVKDFTKETDTLPIPVLRYSPKVRTDLVRQDGANCEISDAMKLVEDKWKVPVVQKNILKSLPNNEGKNILTQLGSIRRQLQLEQLKLDKMLGSDIEESVG